MKMEKIAFVIVAFIFVMYLTTLDIPLWIFAILGGLIGWVVADVI